MTDLEINQELQDLADLHYSEVAEQFFEDMQAEMEYVNALLNDIAEASRQIEIDLRWEQMMNDMYWNLCDCSEEYSYDDL